MRSFIIRSYNTGAILFEGKNYDEACVVREHMVMRALEQGLSTLSFGEYTILWDECIMVRGFARG